ncbi:MAG: FG-GAP-like repeat-containing protein [Pyrinomonadaceae bacterium]
MFALSAGTVRRNIFVFLTVLGVITIIAAAPYYFGTRAADGRTQHLNSPDDVPEGLTSEDWQGIRAAYEANSGITAIAQQAYLKPAAVGPTQVNDQFGWSVAVSGDTVVVGAPGEDSSTTGVNSTANESSSRSGAAYVFTRSGGAWTQQAYLKPAAVGTSQADDEFGVSVAVSSDTVVVGARGEASSTTGVNSTADELASGSGAAYVFTRSGGAWTQQAYLKPAAVGTTQAVDSFGWSVAVSGDTVAIGAPTEDSSTTGINSTADELASNSGAAYVFTRNGGVWTQQAYLKPAAVDTTQAFDEFGISVAVSGDTVAVGAPVEDSSATGVNSTANELASDSGAVYVFTRSGSVWTQQAYLKPAAVGTSQVNDLFGRSLAVSGDTAVVGANGEDSSTTGVNSAANESSSNSGAAYVFTRDAGAWTQRAYLKPAAVGTTQALDNFGLSVAVSGDTVAVGAFAEDSSTTGVNRTANELSSTSGAAYVFIRSGSVWTQQAYLKPAAVGTTQADDWFGWSVAVSDDTVIVGAFLEDSSTTGVNSTANEGSGDSGAAYTIAGLGRTVRTGFDFDGDGKTDVGIFRAGAPNGAEWWYQRSGNGQVAALQFGLGTDKITLGDFTGDGKTDIAFWRPTSGEWFVLRSEDSTFFAFPFGSNGDIPAPADYDGDGRTDAAVFRPTTTTWFISNSGGGTSILNFGLNGDKPVVADYDGDAKADIAIWRAGPGEWWGLRSTNGSVFAVQFGATSDRPVQGDYTGDGKADIAFWRPGSGNWFIIRSEDSSYFAFPFGSSGDIPVPGDYDGDGKTDSAVFRSSSATWFLNRSTAGVAIQQFGLATDTPIPSAFVP